VEEGGGRGEETERSIEGCFREKQDGKIPRFSYLSCFAYL
jgi:hypothetical protein